METVGSVDRIAGHLLGAVEVNRVTCAEVLSIESGDYYVQVLFNHGVTFGEVVSNTFLTGPERLTASHISRLLRLGWSSPDTPCHSSCERPHPNFHRTWPDGVASAQIVRDLVVAMVSISMRGEGGQLTFVEGPRHGRPSTGLPCNH